MIKFLFSLLLLFSYSILQAKVSITNDGTNTNYDIHVDSVVELTKDGGGNNFTRLKLMGIQGYEGVLYKEGKAEIPTITFNVMAEQDSDISINFFQTKSLAKKITHKLYPSQPSTPKIRGAKVPFKMDKSSYKSFGFFPQENFKITTVGSENGRTIKRVTLYPVKYDASVGSYKEIKDFTVSVKHSIKNESASNAFLFIVGDIFANSPELAKYKDLKRALGYKVYTHVVDDSNRSAAQTRDAVQTFYNLQDTSLVPSDLKYALIIGDAEHVPGQKSRHIKGTTDHYFRCIDTDDYQSDIQTPDIGLGRLTVKNNEELAGVLTKLTNYQRGQFSDETWLNEIAFIATDDKYTIAEGSHNHAIENYTAPRNYVGHFPEDPMSGGDRLYAITHRVRDAKVLQSINDGRFIVNYSGHGSTTSWAGPNVSQSNVRSLNHSDARPFVISNACITSQFTIDESFGETWIKHPEGAIVFWGSMDSSYWDEDDILEKAMYKKIYELNDRHFDKITQYALRAVDNFYNGGNRTLYYWETYHIFGDPSLLLRTSKTKNVNIDGSLTIPFGITHANLSLTDDSGAPLANTKVSIYAVVDEEEIISSALSDVSGNVSLDLKGAPAGVEFNLTAYGKNTKLVKSKLLITSSDSPYLLFQKILINGERRKDVSLSEEINFSILIKNVGLEPTKGGEIEIYSIDGPATIISAKQTVSNLSPGESITLGDLKIKINSDAMKASRITVNLKWKLDEGEEATKKITLTVVKGSLAVSSIDFGDAQNPTIGGFNPGETGDIFVTLTNTGTETLKGGVLSPTASNCLDSITGELSIPTLLPGASVRIQTPLSASLNNECKVKELAKISFLGSYQSRVEQISLQVEGEFLIGKISQALYISEERTIIPDNDQAGLVIPFDFPTDVKSIQNLRIKLDVLHTYVGDLEIYLISPEGKKVVIKARREGGSTDNIHSYYGDEGVAIDYSSVIDAPTNGTWQFVIKDLANGDDGSLLRFEVRFKGYEL